VGVSFYLYSPFFVGSGLQLMFVCFYVQCPNRAAVREVQHARCNQDSRWNYRDAQLLIALVPVDSRAHRKCTTNNDTVH
jgi:hypothetical protein